MILASLKAGFFCLKQNYLAPAGNHLKCSYFCKKNITACRWALPPEEVKFLIKKFTAYRWALSFKIE